LLHLHGICSKNSREGCGPPWFGRRSAIFFDRRREAVGKEQQNSPLQTAAFR
jgi:hypothetical protein